MVVARRGALSLGLPRIAGSLTFRAVASVVFGHGADAARLNEGAAGICAREGVFESPSGAPGHRGSFRG